MLNHPNIAPWPSYEHDEIEAAMQTLCSGQVNYWTGQLGKQFETEYAKYVGRKKGIALSNGTVALELALRAFDIGPGDEVIVTSRSYVASATCVLIVGAKPVFADVDAQSGNISATTIQPLINRNTKAIIPVHIGGCPCDMPAIMALANTHQLTVIEDCAQAHGAYIDGKPVGSWGQAAIFSFCQDKIISTGGEGGMLVIDDESRYKKAWAYKDIGRSYDLVYQESIAPGFRWLTESSGSNFRMTEFQAAIGLKQLHKLDSWIQKRNQNAKKIIEVLVNYPFIELNLFGHDANNINAYYRLYAKVKSKFNTVSTQTNTLRDLILREMLKASVPCFTGACAEIYRETLFQSSGLAPTSRLPNAVDFSEHAFCFLVHHTITPEQMDIIAKKIRLVMDSISPIVNMKDCANG